MRGMRRVPRGGDRRSLPGRRRASAGAALAGLLLAVALLGVGGSLLLGGPGAAGGPFALTDSGGHAVTDRDLRGRYLLVYFGYTACPDACPTALNEVAEAMTRLGPLAARVQPLFITLDPARDTPAVVGTFVAAFDPRLLGLTGTPAQVDRVARAFGVAHAVHRLGAGDYAVDHDSVLFLVGPGGRLLASLPAGATGASLAADIARRLS